MLYTIKNNDIRPQYNLALEEYLCHLCACDGRNFFMLWRNEPSVIIGRFQDAHTEINENFVREHNIHVVRRNSGGGAVYHDLGNVNYSFIAAAHDREDRGLQVINRKADVDNTFATFTRPILNALISLGLSVEMSGRNDIVATFRTPNSELRTAKISGGAEWHHNGVLLHHGTLLFNSDLDALSHALNVTQEKLQRGPNDTCSGQREQASKSVQSVRDRVTNIHPLLDAINTIVKVKTVNDFMNFIADRITGEPYALTQDDKREVQRLVVKKYLRPEWNWGTRGEHVPSESVVKVRRRFWWGMFESSMVIRNGTIADCTFSGDYFSDGDNLDSNVLAQRLLGLSINNLTPEVLCGALSGVNIGAIFAGATLEDLVTLFTGEELIHVAGAIPLEKKYIY